MINYEQFLNFLKKFHSFQRNIAVSKRFAVQIIRTADEEWSQRWKCVNEHLSDTLMLRKWVDASSLPTDFIDSHYWHQRFTEPSKQK